MKLTTLLLALPLVAAPVTAQTPVTPLLTSVIGSVVVERSVTIQLGIYIESAAPLPVMPPHVVEPGTRLRFLPLPPGATYGPVQWFKDGQRLAATDALLEIAATATADSGSYSCSVLDANGHAMGSDSAVVFVPANQGQRLVNFSTLARIDAAQPSFLCGFVVEPGPVNRLVLLRAAGPVLSAFGVSGVLAAPQLHLFDARGLEARTNIYPFGFPSIATVSQRVGAFLFPSGSKDVAQLFYLPPGAYTAQLSAADGGSGVALLEIYDVPL